MNVHDAAPEGGTSGHGHIDGIAASISPPAALAAALELAEEHEISVFPCRPDKSPYTTHGHRDATRDPAQIREWWARWPDALVGVPTGRGNGLLVIDIDPDGAEWYREHAERMSCGRVHRTRRGHHLVYSMPEAEIRDSVGRLAPGVDVRAEGGYAISWPAHGHETTGDMTDIGPAPAWLVERLRALARPNGADSAHAHAEHRDAGSHIGAGARNEYLSREAYRLRRQGASAEQITTALGALNVARCAPPLDDAEVRKIAEAKVRNVAPEPVAAPEPLRRPTPPPEPYPVADLGPVLASACESLRRVIQAPDAVCASSLLAAASLAAQALADVHHDGRVMPLSLWLLTVAESGERKSAVDTEAMRAAREYERELALGYEAEQQEHAALLAQWESRVESAKARAKKAGGEGLAAALREIGPAPPPPLVPRITVADFTAEGLTKLLIAGLPAVGAFSDEAALVFGGHGMQRETITRTAGALAKLWDSGTLDRVRAGDGAAKLYGRRLALHLMAQPVIAERALSDPVLSGQGFLARCLLSWPESTAGQRPYVAEDLRRDAALMRLHARLGALLRRPLPLAEAQRNELAPRALTLAADAREAWRCVHDAIEAHMAPSGRYAMVRPWASKAPEQCLRIAGVLTLLEDADASRIETGTIARAAEIVLWHLGEAVRLAGTAELSAEVRDAEALLSWCHETGRELLHSGAALRLGPARIRERPRFTEAMDELERAGWAHPVDGGADIDGAHRRHVWRIVPASEGR